MNRPNSDRLFRRLICQFEVKTKRHFLKRCKYEALRMSDLYIGGMVTILSRTMKIVEYGDAYTARSLASNQQK